MQFINKHFNLQYLDKIVNVFLSNHLVKWVSLILMLLALPVDTRALICLSMVVDVFLIIIPNLDQLERKPTNTKTFIRKIPGFIGELLLFIIVQIFLVAVISLIAARINTSLPINQNEAQLEELSVNYPLLMFLYAVIIGPAVEEISYRYIIPSFFNNRVLGILISNLLFAFGHLAELNLTEIIYFPVYFVMGLLFSARYERTDNIRENIILHQLYNLIGFLLAML